MCNLYGITRSQEAVRRLFRVAHDLTGNLPGLPAVYPDRDGSFVSPVTASSPEPAINPKPDFTGGRRYFREAPKH